MIVCMSFACWFDICLMKFGCLKQEGDGRAAECSNEDGNR